MSTGPYPDLVYLGQAGLMCKQNELSRQTIASAEFAERLALLAECMAHYQGIGIAAPQVGWAARVFCFGLKAPSARYPAAETMTFEYWINPRITDSSMATNWAWEGCLSVPGIRGWVRRPERITMVGWDQHGQEKEASYDGFAARVVQHEYDHLDGILFPMRVTEPRWLLPEASFSRRQDWLAQWPSPGAYQTELGGLSAQV